MKLAIAAGILAQPVPAVSEKTIDFTNSNEQKVDVAGIVSALQQLDAGTLLSNVQAKRNNQGRRKAQTTFAKRPNNAKKMGTLLMNQSSEGKPCDTTSNDPDVGILSCGKGMICRGSKDSVLGGSCVSRQIPEGNTRSVSKTFANFGKRGSLMNTRAWAAQRTDNVVECDPSATPDVGILSCGQGGSCVPSSLSVRGGICSPSLHHRQLSHLVEEAGICDPNSPDYLYFDCDCTNFDNVTGTGIIPCTVFTDYCLGLVYAGCAEACLDRTVEYTFDNFTAPSYSFCFEFSSPSSQKVCLEEIFEEGTCNLTFNDEPCSSCEILPSGNYTAIAFNCSNVEGGRAGVTEDGLLDLLPLIDDCYVPPSNLTECYLCPGGNAVFDFNSYEAEVDVPRFGSFTCYGLYTNAYSFLSISEEYCPTVASATSDTCCSYFCNVCGDDSFIPVESYDISLNVPFPGYEGATCGDLAYAAYYNLSIAPQTCTLASAIAASSCCESSTPQCQICDGAMPDRLATVAIAGYQLPCYTLEFFLNETECSLLPQVVAEDCGCTAEGDPPTSSPSHASPPPPTPTPSSSTGGVDSGSASIYSSMTLMSLLGPAAAAAVIALN